MSFLNDFKRMAEGRAMPSLTESSEPRDEKALTDSLEKALVDALKKSAKQWSNLRVKIDASDSNDPQDAQMMDFDFAIDAYYPEITVDDGAISGVMHFANAKGNTGKILRATEPSDVSSFLTDEDLEQFESQAQVDFEDAMEKYVPAILKDAFPKYDVKKIRVGFGIQADDAVGVEWELAPKKGMKNEAAEGADAAQTILKQMGGAGRIKTMIGAKNFVSSGNSVMFQFPNPNRIANKVRITLDPNDTYTMEFYKGASADPVKSFEGLYASDLRKTFEQFTKMYLSLGTMGGAMEGVERDSVTARMRALLR